MPNPYILMWLEAPLQSWGADSKFGRRDTLEFPTKSGIMGLICCALGAGGEQCELLAKFADLDLEALSFTRDKVINKKNIKTAPEPFLRDFHMVGSGYDDKDPWQKLLIPKTSDGKAAVGGGAKLTYRYYLQDMAFAALVEVPEELSEQIANALQNPIWDLYLGRKNCVPTDFIFRGIFASKDEATQKAQEIAKDKGRSAYLRVLQGKLEDGTYDSSFILNDVPVKFGTNKQYKDRQVSIIYAQNEPSNE